MKNKELFEKTVNILVKAYQNNTLEYNDCKTCAVGNIVAGNLGIELFKNRLGQFDTKGGNSGSWGDAFRTFGEGVDGLYSVNTISEKSLMQIKSTGYSLFEVALIEKSFFKGTNDSLFNCKDENFSGLMSVVDCLMEIHKANEEETNLAKSLFVKETV